MIRLCRVPMLKSERSANGLPLRSRLLAGGPMHSPPLLAPSPSAASPLTSQLSVCNDQTPSTHPALATSLRFRCDGSGALTVWHVLDGKHVRMPEWSEQGLLRGDDCCIIKYTWLAGGSNMTILFGWSGRAATQLEIGTMALQLDKVGLHTRHLSHPPLRRSASTSSSPIPPAPSLHCTPYPFLARCAPIAAVGSLSRCQS